MNYFAVSLPLLLALHWPASYAQSGCSSDGAAPPRALYERFISADCAACWSDATFAPGPSAAVLDWIAPGPSADEAPLSAAARRDAIERLTAMARPAPAATDVHVAPMALPLPGRFRVALGPAVNDYVSASASYSGTLPPGADADSGWTLWLALVEAIPAGAEGTPVRRNLVRNVFYGTWGISNKLSKRELANLPPRTRWIERRAMQFAHGADPARLGLVGWLQDAQGQVLALARADCSAAP